MNVYWIFAVDVDGISFSMMLFKTFHVTQLSFSIPCMSIWMYGWDILLVFVLFFGKLQGITLSWWLIGNSCNVQLVVTVKSFTYQWFLSNIMTPLLSQQKQSGRTLRWWQKYWHENAVADCVKRCITKIFKMIIVN